MNFKKTAAIVAAAGALTALAIPAMAEFTPYASIRVLTGWQMTDTNAAGSKMDGDVFLGFPAAASGRLGFKMADGPLGGQIEFGVNQGGGNIVDRLFFGTYKFAGGSLLVGQDYTKSWNPSAAITNDTPSNGGFGNFYAGRLPQIRAQFDNGFYVAAIQPTTGLTNPNQELYLPKLNVGYDGAAGAVGYGAGVDFQTYKDEALAKQISSFLVYARAKTTAGPLALKANFGIGQNLGNMGYNAAGSQAAGYVVSAGEVKNSYTYEGYVQAGYTVSPTLGVNLIIGGQANSNTTWDKTDMRMAYNLNAPITIVKNFTITPEVALYDEMKDKNGNKQQQDYYVGAKWQLDF